MSIKFNKEEQNFLSGPRARWKELIYVLGAVVQFIKGFRAMHFIGPCVTVFGSARFSEDHPYYKVAREFSAKIAQLGFTIMTGGGPGIMEAANRGAKDVGGYSIGCNILLAKEQHINPYLDKFVTIDYFFVRKELLRKYSFAFIVLPGGFGTLDEFFETVTLIQTKKMSHFPIVVIGMDYHKDLIKHINTMVASNTIGKSDSEIILFTDSIEEAVEHINKYALSDIALKKQTKYQPIAVLGEKV
jgi:uncharacterized protein (TIGR00730 family)